MDLFTAAKSINIIDVYNQYCGETKKIRKGHKSTAVTCPFHEDKRPSLNLYPNNTFYCFSCQKGGSNVDLVMEVLHLDKVSAAKRICEDFHIEYEDRYQSKSPDESERRGLLETNRILANYFHTCLAKAPNPKYFEDRGLSNIPDEYLLGYCPEGRIFNKNVETAQRLGFSNERGECVFAGRYIVPIRDIHNVIIGFVGRLPDEKVDDFHPKYINSCNSKVFRKREVFFNSGCLLEKSDAVIVVEGVFDALSYIASGVTNVISPLGNSLSDSHLEILRKFTNKTVVLSFDRDEAGVLATKKAICYAKNLRLGISIGDFKGHKDANELLIKEGPAAVSASTQYLPAPEYVLKQYEDGNVLNSLAKQEELWTVFAIMLGSKEREKKYPMNTAYTPVAYEHYWSLFKKVLAANPVR